MRKFLFTIIKILWYVIYPREEKSFFDCSVILKYNSKTHFFKEILHVSKTNAIPGCCFMCTLCLSRQSRFIFLFQLSLKLNRIKPNRRHNIKENVLNM